MRKLQPGDQVKLRLDGKRRHGRTDDTTVQVINNGGQGRLALMYRVVVDGREGNWFLGPSEYVAALVADLAAASASRAFAPRNTDPGDVGERLASLDSWLLNHEERIARLEREREHRR